MKILQFLLFFAVTFGFGQDNNIDPVQTISEEACTCIEKISAIDDTKYKAIKNCIATAIVNNLNTDVSANKNNVSEIQIETEAYLKIEAYLVENCAALKQLSFSENETFQHSTSHNVLAQLAYDDGLDYMQEGDYESAILKFKKAIEIDPKFAFAWDNLGISYRKTNQYEQAIEAYKKSLEINPEGRMPLMNIAMTYNLKKEYNEAIKHYNKFIAVYPEDAEGYYGLGLIQYTNNNQESGLDNMIHAYTIYTAQNSPYRADAAKKIGFMYNDLKNQEKLEVFNTIATKYNLKIDSK